MNKGYVNTPMITMIDIEQENLNNVKEYLNYHPKDRWVETYKDKIYTCEKEIEYYKHELKSYNKHKWINKRNILYCKKEIESQKTRLKLIVELIHQLYPIKEYLMSKGITNYFKVN